MTEENSDYLRGTGYYLLAKGEVIIEVEFKRASGKKFVCEYIQSKIFTKNTLSGKVVASQTLIVSNGLPVVQLAPIKGGSRTTVNADGSFALDVYDPDIELWVGFDKDNNYELDMTDYPKYPREYLVNNISGSITGLIYTLE